MKAGKLAKAYRVDRGKHFRLKDFDPADTAGWQSKELAEDIQDSLSKRIQKTNKPVKNRGVRKAPFVVLIGADMPSILTEISFLSNPADEQMLKKPEQRQKVAEGLYQGVVGYLESMNSVTMNRPAKTGAGHASAASVEQSRNQN